MLLYVNVTLALRGTATDADSGSGKEYIKAIHQKSPLETIDVGSRMDDVSTRPNDVSSVARLEERTLQDKQILPSTVQTVPKDQAGDIYISSIQ